MFDVNPENSCRCSLGAIKHNMHTGTVHPTGTKHFSRSDITHAHTYTYTHCMSPWDAYKSLKSLNVPKKKKKLEPRIKGSIRPFVKVGTLWVACALALASGDEVAL